MTSYHGGKQRIGKEIAQVIRDTVCKVEAQTGVAFKGYLEPFCGMLGVYQHIPKLFQNYRYPLKYKAGDINESVIKMWKALQRGWEPPTKCSQKRFYELKGNGKSSAEKGFVGHACAFRGVYFAAYDSRVTNNRLLYTKKNISRISNILIENQVELKHTSYSDWSNIKRNIIYCDPPYFKGSNYRDESNIFQNFDYDRFYQWTENMTRNNLVFVSERQILPYTVVGQFMGNEKLYLINNFMN
jgi:site-specific DNA-adenine methylase